MDFKKHLIKVYTQAMEWRVDSASPKQADGEYLSVFGLIDEFEKEAIRLEVIIMDLKDHVSEFTEKDLQHARSKLIFIEIILKELNQLIKKDENAEV